MSYKATDFKEWYEDKYLKDKGEFDKLPPEDQKKFKEEFKDFDAVLKYMDKSYKEYKGFTSDAQKKYDDIAASLSGKNDDDRSKLLEQGYKNLMGSFSSKKGGKSGDEDANWIAEKIKHWNDEWCQDPAIHDPKYTFDRVTEDAPDTELKFNIYKDEGKTLLGATVHYASPRDVTLETEEGKVPDFEFFDKMIHEAVSNDGIPAVNFANADEMTDDFKAKLAIACIKHGIPMEGFDGNVDLKKYLTEEEFKKLPAETQNEIEYRDIKNAVKLSKANGDTVKISSEQKDKSTVAMLYAAAKEVDAKVEGFEAFTKDSHGMFILPAKEKEILPKEVRAAINKVNSDVKEKNIEDIRAKVKINTDPGNASVIAKFNEFDDARNLMNLMMKTDAGKSLRANLDRENHDRDLALAGKPARFNVSVKDEDVIAFLESLKDKDHKFSEPTLETLFPDKKKRGEFLRNTKHPEEQVKLFKERYAEASDAIKNDAKFIKNTKDHHSAYNMARNKLLGHSL